MKKFIHLYDEDLRELVQKAYAPISLDKITACYSEDVDGEPVFYIEIEVPNDD